MAIEIQKEELVSFAQVAAMLPPRRRNRPVHVTTIRRWREPGIRGVRLEAVRVGGAWHTSVEAFARFCERLTAIETGESGAATIGTAISAAKLDAELSQEGW